MRKQGADGRIDSGPGLEGWARSLICGIGMKEPIGAENRVSNRDIDDDFFLFLVLLLFLLLLILLLLLLSAYCETFL